jgi:hypothetical protein
MHRWPFSPHFPVLTGDLKPAQLTAIYYPRTILQTRIAEHDLAFTKGERDKTRGRASS